MPSIDIDREAAHQAAQRELDKPIYPKDSLTKELTDWIDEQLYRILEKGSSIPGGWFTITVLLILLMIAVTAAVQIARRTMRTNRGGDYQLFDAGQLTAAQHRSTAESYAAEGGGLRRSATGYKPWLASWRRPACSTRLPGAPPTSWPAMRARFYRIWQGN